MKIPKRETLGPFDWNLMGFIGVPLFKGQVMRNDENEKEMTKGMTNITYGTSPAVHLLGWISCGGSPAVDLLRCISCCASPFMMHH